ncbi:MAG: type IV secretory system conjugative DNA transfer family protein [Kineosporiaceae bacterium]
MSAPSQRNHATLAGDLAVAWAGIGAGVVTVTVINVAVRVAAALDPLLSPRHRPDETAAGSVGDGQPLPGNPVHLAVDVVTGAEPWTAFATAAAAVLVVILGLAALVGVRWGPRLWRAMQARLGKAGVDAAAAHLARARDLTPLTHAGAAATTRRLHPPGSSPSPFLLPPGLPLGTTLDGHPLVHSWEDVTVDIWGPRTGKTTARAIPAVMTAPGAVVVTSNKRDIVDATRGPRARAGRVWVFDPQQIVGENPTWWWDPLTFVTDEATAATLADIFAMATRPAGARTDAYFDGAGQELLGNLMLAAARAGRPLTQVYEWLTDPTDDEPAIVLAKHGFPMASRAIAGVVAAPDRQRSGVFGTAQQMAAVMTSSAAMRWVTPRSDGPDTRPRFDPAAFVCSAHTGSPETVYSLSKEGKGTAGPLVTALTVAITEAAEILATRSPGGRLPVPLVAVLDEAANVVRWRALPDMYSHYGSRGIVVMTLLQSWSQGVEVWGRDGMRKLWSAATVKVYGGGVTEAEFLDELSRLVGSYERTTWSTTHGRGGRQRSRATRTDRILDVADLAALPRGRAVVLASGTRSVLVRATPWMDTPYAAQVRASMARYDGHRPSGPLRAGDQSGGPD